MLLTACRTYGTSLDTQITRWTIGHVLFHGMVVVEPEGLRKGSASIID